MSLLRTTRGGKSVDFALSNGGALLGAAPGCQIVVADPAAAPKHTKIVRSPQGFVLTDLSGGGTVVNGAKVKEHVLKHGDVVQIGSEKFTFTEKAATPAAPAKPASTGSAPAPKSVAAAAPAVVGGRRPLPPRPPHAHRSLSAEVATHAPARKLTVKPGSVPRVHKDHHMFALPSTTKGKTIAIGVGVGLVLIGGALFAISSQTVNSDQVKQKAEEAIKQLELIPESEHEKRLAMIEDILGNPDYVKYAPEKIQPAARVRDEVKKRVDLEVLASNVAKRFLEEYKTLKEGPAEDFKKEWERLYDTVKVHLEKFERTRYGAELEKVRGELKANMENVGPNWSDEIVKLSREVSRLIKAGQFNTAMIEVDTFGTKYGEKGKDAPVELKRRVAGERDRINTDAKEHVERLIKESALKGSLQEKKQLLEAARPFIKGLTEAEKLLDKAIREFK
jgi:FHA domain-containing protein